MFEVVEAITHSDGSARYRLEPWPDRHAVRSIRTYDAASETGRPLVKAGYRKSILRRLLAIVFSPLLGHLPGPVQEHMESEFGAPALAMTIVSALPLCTGHGLLLAGGRKLIAIMRSTWRIAPIRAWSTNSIIHHCVSIFVLRPSCRTGLSVRYPAL